jgi:putative hemolysin
MEEVNSLIIFTKASLMLAEADTIQKAKELKNLALTAADWAKRKGMGEEAIQYCRGYALEAERKMGEMLEETERNPGGRHPRKPVPVGNMLCHHPYQNWD